MEILLWVCVGVVSVQSVALVTLFTVRLANTALIRRIRANQSNILFTTALAEAAMKAASNAEEASVKASAKKSKRKQRRSERRAARRRNRK